MAVSRKAMTEGIRISLFPSTLCERNLTIPQSKIKDFCQLPLHKGASGCSRTPSGGEPEGVRGAGVTGKGKRLPLLTKGGAPRSELEYGWLPVAIIP